MILNSDNVFVINLDRDTERWQNVYDRMVNVGITPTRFPATYGKTIDKDTEKNLISKMCSIFCPDGLKGCGVSHMRVWQKIVDEDIPYALVLEDDAIPVDGFQEKFNKSMDSVPHDWDVLYLFCLGTVACSPDINFKKLENHFVPYLPGGTTAYMVTNLGAKKLLKCVKKVSWHIDSQMALTYLNNDTHVYVSNPLLFLTDTDGSTNASVRPIILSKLVENIHIGYGDVGWHLRGQLIKLPLTEGGFIINGWFIIILAVLTLLVRKRIISFLQACLLWIAMDVADSFVGQIGFEYNTTMMNCLFLLIAVLV